MQGAVCDLPLEKNELTEISPEVADVVARTGRQSPDQLVGYDAIVVGAGASGSLAADELTHAGLKVLVLDAGWREPFLKDPLRQTVFGVMEAMATPRIAELVPRNILWKAEQMMRKVGAMRQPVQSRCYAWPSAPDGFVDDKAHPYEAPAEKPFDWIRYHGIGGRVVVPLHGRQWLRHGSHDFQPDDGLTENWPITYADLEPWYDKAESKMQMKGGDDHSPWVPDAKLTTVMSPSPAETEVMNKLKAAYTGVQPLMGRFSAPPTPLLNAARTGLVSCRTGAIARHIELDGEGRATGVVYFDRRTKKLQTVNAPLVFMCAATLETTRMLLTTRLEHGIQPVDPDKDPLGANIMDHAYIKVEGTADAIDIGDAENEVGRCVYLPRFDLRHGGEGAGRGFGVRVYRSPIAGGKSYYVAAMDGEMLPRLDNRARLSDKRRNAYGMPILDISVSHGEYERALAPKMAEAQRELAEMFGVNTNNPITDELGVPGSTIHECGSARMGDDPATSVVNPVNECWDMKGVRVTDGACFTTQGIQNPTLTILALTARACADAAANL